MQNTMKTRRLTESALMIAAATILSMTKLLQLPYGGSVTLASMLPIVIIAYRYGTPWGLLTASVYGLIQFALGTKNIGALPAQSFVYVASMILADYVLAFMVVGFGGVFRKVFKTQVNGLLSGCILAAVLRFVCHVIGGWTVWASFELSEAGMIYSISYNTTYMLPELLILVVATFFLGNALDFRGEQILPLPVKEKNPTARAFGLAAGAFLAFAAIFDTIHIFKPLQDPDTGRLVTENLAKVDWLLIGIVTAVCVVFAVAFLLVSHSLKRSGNDR